MGAGKDSSRTEAWFEGSPANTKPTTPMSRREDPPRVDNLIARIAAKVKYTYEIRVNRCQATSQPTVLSGIRWPLRTTPLVIKVATDVSDSETRSDFFRSSCFTTPVRRAQ